MISWPDISFPPINLYTAALAVFKDTMTTHTEPKTAAQTLARMTGLEKRSICFADSPDRLEYLRQTCFGTDGLTVEGMATVKRTVDAEYSTAAHVWK